MTQLLWIAAAALIGEAVRRFALAPAWRSTREGYRGVRAFAVSLAGLPALAGQLVTVTSQLQQAAAALGRLAGSIYAVQLDLGRAEERLGRLAGDVNAGHSAHRALAADVEALNSRLEQLEHTHHQHKEIPA